MAHTPANYDLSIWKGNDETFLFHFGGETSGSDFDLTGSTLIFNAKWSSTGALTETLTLDADPTSGSATLELTFEQTRLLPTSKTVNYEIERRIAGRQTTLLYGVVTVNGGNNTDD